MLIVKDPWMTGGVMANIIIQHRFAQLLSDTFTIPGYFHFFTLGSVSLVFMASIMLFSPLLRGRINIAFRSISYTAPAVIVIGIVIFGIAGILGGYLGLPRRTLEFNYSLDFPVGNVWNIYASTIGLGGIIMALSGFAYLLAVIASFIGLGKVRITDLEFRDFRPDKNSGINILPISPFIVVALLLATIATIAVVTMGIIENLPIEIGGH